jgi:Zn-finger nucleic acid-binding protein
MKCPIDSSTLVMSNREGIEIDYCPECRGVWLDRGELDKIVERSARTPTPQPAPNYDYDNRGGHDRDKRSDHGNDRSSHGGQKKRGRESWIGDLFG